ncbi:MAG: tRNA (guanosine(37)-N1)-methyltransferase TrmD [Pseudomonadota bacterium]
MRFDILTLHPDLCTSPVEHSILGRARQAGLIDVRLHNLREHGLGRYKQCDDEPYGGGSGMVLRVDVIDRALEPLRGPDARIVLLEASGQPFTQAVAARLATLERLVLVCGHYEGVDARVREHLVDETLSVGDFVLTGGELPALIIVDAVARLLPGVLGCEQSATDESFQDGTLEYPQYTRPRVYRDWEVPEILLSGHHAKVARWRREQALARTRALRPDLLDDDEGESG